MSKVFYLTTPLYYVNDIPHVGHAYTTAIADAIARYKRLCGVPVCLLTGTDEHGLKIERTARDRREEPQSLVDRNAEAFRATWADLGIRFDEFIRTTQPRHLETVQSVFRKIRDNGYIYLDEYSGLYCVRDEAYVTSEDGVCPQCGGPTEFIREECYFFKLSAFQEKLLAFYRDTPDFVIPSTRMNEIVSFVMSGLRDISISRTSFRWGIPVPDSGEHIFYVWFDALLGYLSGIGYAEDQERFKDSWPASLQLMGKDILRFHGVYWPAFLMACGLEPPRHLLVHGWWMINGEKMSKSLGNFVTVEALLKALPRDCVKYFLLRENSLGSDGNFSYDSLVTRLNSDLANDLGNLSSRVLKMIESYFGGKVPESAGLESGDEQLVHFSKETVKLYRENFDKLQLNRALENVWELISVANRYIVANEPWSLSKDAAKRDRLGSVLYNAAETLRIVAVLLTPILTDGTASIFRQLGWEKTPEQCRAADLSWGGLKAGSPIGEVQAIYPRIVPEELLAALPPAPVRPAVDEAVPSPEESASPSPAVATIGIEDFSKVELRVGRILAAERVPKSQKLLKLQVDLGREVRQVVAGIGKAYEPESLPGRLVGVVVNLRPATLMGVESNGMILAATSEGSPVLAEFDETAEVGSRIK